MSEVTAVFFDIDGTLIDTHGAGKDAFARAIKEVFGVEDDLRFINFAGATDIDIFKGVAAHLGIAPTRKQEREFFRQLPIRLNNSITHHVVTMCPGVRELLKILSNDENFLVGLLTGNTADCAHIKLSACDLHGHFVLGAFGREHGRRADLARLVLKRAKKYLKTKKLKRVFVVGDTPADVAAAKAIDAASIAVATGTYNLRALQDAGAHHVLRDLTETEKVLGILRGE